MFMDELVKRERGRFESRFQALNPLARRRVERECLGERPTIQVSGERLHVDAVPLELGRGQPELLLERRDALFAPAILPRRAW